MLPAIPEDEATAMVTDNLYQYKPLLNAGVASVLRVSVGFAVFGLFRGGLGGALVSYIVAVTLSTLGMAVLGLAVLPVLLGAKKPLSLPSFSLISMLILAVAMYLIGVVCGGNWVFLNAGQAGLILCGILYGAPIGYIMQAQQQRKMRFSPPQDLETV